jgi:hypothetical protein
VFGGNSTLAGRNHGARHPLRRDAFGGLVFFGSAFAPNSSFPPLADFRAYTVFFNLYRSRGPT